MSKNIVIKKEEPAEPDFQLRVEIDDMVFQKIMHWVNKANYECSGLGKVIYDEENNCFRVIDAVILKQENTAGTTEISAEAITKAMFELKDTPGSLNWWWHSHVKMNVFWSGTDLEAIEKLGRGGWFLSTVFNQFEEMRSCFYQTVPFQVFADQLETSIHREIPAELVDQWDRDYNQNVTIKTYQTGGRFRGGRGHQAWFGAMGFGAHRSGWDRGGVGGHAVHMGTGHSRDWDSDEVDHVMGSNYLPASHRLANLTPEQQDFLANMAASGMLDGDDDEFVQVDDVGQEWEEELDALLEGDGDEEEEVVVAAPAEDDMTPGPITDGDDDGNKPSTNKKNNKKSNKQAS